MQNQTKLTDFIEKYECNRCGKDIMHDEEYCDHCEMMIQIEEGW